MRRTVGGELGCESRSDAPPEGLPAEFVACCESTVSWSAVSAPLSLRVGDRAIGGTGAGETLELMLGAHVRQHERGRGWKKARMGLIHGKLERGYSYRQLLDLT